MSVYMCGRCPPRAERLRAAGDAQVHVSNDIGARVHLAIHKHELYSHRCVLVGLRLHCSGADRTDLDHPPLPRSNTAVGPTRLTWFCIEIDVLSSTIRMPRYFSVISCKRESIGPKWESAVRGNQRKWESAISGNRSAVSGNRP
jgi:hypothetical protein